MEKAPVLIGTHPTTNLAVYRLFKYFIASRDEETIRVYYDEFFGLSDGTIVVENKQNKFYMVKNIPAIAEVLAVDAVLDEDGNILIPAITGRPGVAAYTGFDNWFNYDIGVFPNGTTLGAVIVGAINTTLQAIPIGADSGYVTTP